MRSWLFPAAAPPARALEATPQQVIATGAAGAGYGVDPLDQDRGWAPAGRASRPVPWWTVEKARIHSVASYRSNPIAKAIIDTYTSFCVGDVGVSYQCSNPAVSEVVKSFWDDPDVQLGELQELLLRDHLQMGETCLELLQGERSGELLFSPVAVSRITDVRLLAGNPLWPAELVFTESVPGTGGPGYGGLSLPVARVDRGTGLRAGKVAWWRSWRALVDDVRGYPFLAPILDQLDAYDTVLSNLIDRTALARYLVWDVTVEGDQSNVDAFVAARGGTHIPPSGSVEVHNSSVSWEPKTAETRATEDSVTARSVLTQVAAGAGLAKTWLAEPDGANRATSLSMAEPVRRRVGGVQRLWLGYIAELVRFRVDRAVAARRLPQTVTATDQRTRAEFQIPASQAVHITGPSISASDAEFTAKILLNLATGLEKMVKMKALSPEAAQVAARKAWEDYVGIPYTADLDTPADPDADGPDQGDVDELATAVDEAFHRGGNGILHQLGAIGTEAFDPALHPRDRRGRFRQVLSPGASGLATITRPRPSPAGALAGSVATGVSRVVRQLPGGQTAEVELVELGDGTLAVRKTPSHGWVPLLGPVEDQLDAEELAVLVADAVSVAVPRVHRAAPDTILMAYVDADVAQTAGHRAADWVDTDEGLLMGLLDLLIFNGDRHSRNWMVDGGRLVGIDHGAAWEVEDPDQPPPPGRVKPFQGHFIDIDGEVWTDNDLSPQDIATVRGRLQALRGEFETRGAADWFSRTMRRLDAIGAHATGTRVRLR